MKSLRKKIKDIDFQKSNISAHSPIDSLKSTFCLSESFFSFLIRKKKIEYEIKLNFILTKCSLKGTGSLLLGNEVIEIDQISGNRKEIMFSQ